METDIESKLEAMNESLKANKYEHLYELIDKEILIFDGEQLLTNILRDAIEQWYTPNSNDSTFNRIYAKDKLSDLLTSSMNRQKIAVDTVVKIKKAMKEIQNAKEKRHETDE